MSLPIASAEAERPVRFSVRTPPALGTDPRFDAPVSSGLAVSILFTEPDTRRWTAGKGGCLAGVSCD